MSIHLHSGTTSGSHMVKFGISVGGSYPSAINYAIVRVRHPDIQLHGVVLPARNSLRIQQGHTYDDIQMLAATSCIKAGKLMYHSRDMDIGPILPVTKTMLDFYTILYWSYMYFSKD